MRKELFLILIFLFIQSFTFAQSALEKSAGQEVEERNYTKAIQLYEKALKREKDKSSVASIYKKLGDCYDGINRYNSAVFYYNKYLELDGSPGEGFLINYYTLVLKCGLIKEALDGFEALEKQDPNNPEIAHMARCCKFASGQMSRKNLQPVKKQEQLNSPESEFGLAFYEGGLVFSSQQLVNDHVAIAGRTNEGYSDIYFAGFDSILDIFVSPEKMPGKINSNFNEGTFTFHKPTQTAYITQCDRGAPVMCRIMSSKLANNKWQDLKEVPITSHPADYAHPVLSPDGRTMYFSSNMPGGFGGRDIWKVSVSGYGTLGHPENLGSLINSEKEEMFPSVIGDSVLLFASNGHVGMGGLDIFYSKITDNVYEQPQNLGAPINSTGDDFSIIVAPGLAGGYFCSKRGSEENSDDIYRFYHNIFSADIEGIIVDSILTSPLAGVKITCKSGEETAGVFYSDSTGAFYIPSATFKDLKKKNTLSFYKNGYIARTMGLPSKGEVDIMVTLYNNLGMHSIEGFITDITNGQPIVGAEIKLTTLRNRQDVVYTDKNGFYSLPDIPSNDYLLLHVGKDGYLSDSRNFASPGKTQKLCMNKTTNYPTSFELYPVVEDVEFKINNIYYEFDKARLLTESKHSLDKLVNLLKENPDVKIKINSHTDERGTYEYNDNLSDRRSESVVAYLLEAGIAASRLRSEGFGESKPVVANAETEEGHALNRRTTFELLDVNKNK